METYKNLGGNSGISSYAFENDFIKIKFKDGSVYLYTYASTGMENVEQMKKFAQKGRGLTTFINKYVRERYEAQLR